jgi:hypothetical protein
MELTLKVASEEYSRIAELRDGKPVSGFPAQDGARVSEDPDVERFFGQ